MSGESDASTDRRREVGAMSEGPLRVLYAGADLRCAPALLPPRWLAERRSTYLLQRNTETPLSVDTMVWPSLATDESMLPWVPLASVRAHADAGAAVVVVGVVADTLSVAKRVAELYGICDELVVDEAWLFLGFDVADAPDGISGLCNCGYSEAEHTVLAGLFGSQLNPYGLFHDAASALRFRDVADTRVSAHAPFDVFGLWRVDP